MLFSRRPDLKRLLAENNIRGLAKAIQYRKDRTIQLAVIESLAELTSGEGLAKAFKYRDKNDEKLGILIIDKLGTLGLYSSLIELLNESKLTTNEHLRIIEQLGRIANKESIEAIIATFRKQKLNMEVREKAINALGGMNAESVIALLMPLATGLTDKSFLRGCAIKALGGINTENVISSLIQIASTSSEPKYYIGNALEALTKMNKEKLLDVCMQNKNDALFSTIEGLIGFATSNEEQAIQGLKFLEFLNDRRSIELIFKTAYRSDAAKMRLAAKEVIFKLDTKTSEILYYEYIKLYPYKFPKSSESRAYIQVAIRLLNSWDDMNSMTAIISSACLDKEYYSDNDYDEIVKGIIEQNESSSLLPFLLKEILYVAIKSANHYMFSFVLSREREIDVNIRNESFNNWTPLHYAVWELNVDMVKALLHKGANANAVTSIDNNLRSPIDIDRWSAFEIGREDVLKCGHATPLHFAADMPHWIMRNIYDLTLLKKYFSKANEIIRCLMDFGANPNIGDDHGRTPLTIIASKGVWAEDDVQLVSKYLNMRHLSQRISSHLSILNSDQYREEETMDAYKEHPGYINKQLEKYFREQISISVAEMLGRGADPNLEDINNKTPLDYSRTWFPRLFEESIIASNNRNQGIDQKESPEFRKLAIALIYGSIIESNNALDEVKRLSIAGNPLGVKALGYAIRHKAGNPDTELYEPGIYAGPSYRGVDYAESLLELARYGLLLKNPYETGLQIARFVVCNDNEALKELSNRIKDVGGASQQEAFIYIFSYGKYLVALRKNNNEDN